MNPLFVKLPKIIIFCQSLRRVEHLKEVKLEESAYQFDAKMSLKQAIPLGLQHVCAMFVGNLTPLLIITSACGIAGGEFADLQVTLLQSAMFVAGVVTLVQLFTIGPVGGGVPIIMGTSSGFIGVFNSVVVCWPMVPSWVHPSSAASLKVCWVSS